MPEYEDLNPRFLDALKIKRKVPFENMLGMEVVDVKKGRAVVRLPFSEKLKQPYGMAHGAAVMAPADTAVALALAGMCERDEIFTTVELKINYIKPFEKGEILAEARIISKGRTIAVGDVDVLDSEGRLIAKCLATYSIARKT